MARRSPTPNNARSTPLGKPYRLYSAVHVHGSGHTTYLFWADHVPTEEEVVEQVLQAEFEPELDEWIGIEEADLWEAVVIK